jgi:hypothetical protein
LCAFYKKYDVIQKLFAHFLSLTKKQYRIVFKFERQKTKQLAIKNFNLITKIEVNISLKNKQLLNNSKPF